MIQFECQKVALKQDSNGFVLTLRIHPDEIPEELLRDFVGARYACGLVRVQEDDTPVVYSNRTMKAGILCRNTMFQQFLFSEHDSSAVNEESAIKKLYELCNITSRTELNGNQKAQEVFDQVVKDYEHYERNSF
jgi:hypothetical protein